ncbi:DUF4350 domain-containing protein [Actinomadura rudentiformis]|uniref:DUF4350 domain-containing protein n=1 Tax=Actinomadura rudentiformis TaxID=359158 RepID=A0A6H9Z8H9_9ACTN|nr:DUF4350 domain-containing protein [Actinomadura rudentiformis]KAB2351506.1 DUF4350 domain-containing protein [Actinomadura rudentiformis]
MTDTISAPTQPSPAPAGDNGNGGGDTTARQVAQRRWRASRGIVLVIFATVLVAIILAALKPTVTPGYLDPTEPGRDGTRALAEVLKQRGTPVTVTRRAADAVSQSNPSSVLVITKPENLTPADVGRLRAASGDLLLVTPSRELLEALAPGVFPAAKSLEEVAEPGCSLPAATLAGRVDFGRSSETYELPSGAAGCYRADEFARVVQLPPTSAAGRTVTIIGSATPLTNENLTKEGNAALAMNLAGARSSVVWLIPDRPRAGSGGDKSLGDLIPFGVNLFFFQLAVAVVLIALWRARRLGPVVAEALPVAVRSAETVEGRARLYRAHHARERAAAALRAGAIERLVPLLGLPRSAAQDPAAAHEIVAAVARRTNAGEAAVGAALYGPEPADDAQLVGLTDFLDDLERQVRES